ncbi:uncharacterized protein LOC141849862 [Brevipalpus obovatus]|uniref:uncharacterized protein LOC141849862 n=1 Tax=Brevipalpus obovatus TaxID=246614 RepID=UPI003D9F9910
MIKQGSSLLRWTGQSVKSSKSSNGKPNWIHHPEALQAGHVVYLVKFLGNTEVDQPKGIGVVKEGIRKMKFNQHLRRAEGTKTPKVELTISVDGVAIQDPKTRKISYQYPLHRISYCADDKTDPKFFSFIAKEADSEKHHCFVFVSDKLAEEITLTIGQAFDLAYRRFLETSGRDLEMRKQLMMLHKRVQELENENSQLRARLSVYENTKSRSSSGAGRTSSSSSSLTQVTGKSSHQPNHQHAGESNGVNVPLQPLQPPPPNHQRSQMNRSTNQTINLLDFDLNDTQPTVGRKLENLSLDDRPFDPRAFESPPYSHQNFPPSSSQPLAPLSPATTLPSASSPNSYSNNNGQPPASYHNQLDEKTRNNKPNTNGNAAHNGPNGSSNGCSPNDVTQEDGNEEKDIFGFTPFNPENIDQNSGTDPFGMHSFEAKELEQAIGAIDKRLAEMRDGFSRGLSFGNVDSGTEQLGLN